jgi:hypothetical protein
MVNVLEAVEFFHRYADNVWNSALRAETNEIYDEWEREEYDEPPTYTPASENPMQPPTALRMRRALLRIQLYAELFHGPGDSPDNTNDWETRIPEIKMFWGQYGLAEMRECKCIYAAISLSVEHELLYKKLEPPLDKDLLQLRGLPPLQRCLRPSTPITKFGLSYVRRLIDTNGFWHVDPRDDLLHNHQVLPNIFLWNTPHGGLGQIPRQFGFIYAQIQDAGSSLVNRIMDSFVDENC